MSYDLHFEVDGKVVEFDERHDIKGGSYALGGTNKASLNITYNYGWFFHRMLKSEKETGIRSLYGMTARQVIDAVESAIDDLGTSRHGDYWAPTPGNAGAALADLKSIAEMCPPDAVLAGD